MHHTLLKVMALNEFGKDKESSTLFSKHPSVIDVLDFFFSRYIIRKTRHLPAHVLLMEIYHQVYFLWRLKD